MTQDKPISSEKYEGPSTATVVAGKAYLYGWGGNFIGAAIGAAASGLGITRSKWGMEKAHNLMKWAGVSWNEKATVMVAGGATGWLVGHWVGQAFAIGPGRELADHARVQFEQIKSERNQARAELAQLKSDGPKHTVAIPAEAQPGHLSLTENLDVAR